MKESEPNKFVMYDENGNEVVFDVLFTFDNDETGKSYIVYTDNSLDDDGNVKVYASVVISETNGQKLESIETTEEWETIESILEMLQEKVRNNEELPEYI